MTLYSIIPQKYNVLHHMKIKLILSKHHPYFSQNKKYLLFEKYNYHMEKAQRSGSCVLTDDNSTVE